MPGAPEKYALRRHPAVFQATAEQVQPKLNIYHNPTFFKNISD